MNPAPRQLPRLEWWRFAILAISTTLIIGGVALIPPRDDVASLTVVLFGVSVVTFFGYRWRCLRVALAKGQLTAEQFYRNPRAHVVGPLGARVAWFAVTLMAMLVVVAFGVTKGA